MSENQAVNQEDPEETDPLCTAPNSDNNLTDKSDDCDNLNIDIDKSDNVENKDNPYADNNDANNDDVDHLSVNQQDDEGHVDDSNLQTDIDIDDDYPVESHLDESDAAEDSDGDQAEALQPDQEEDHDMEESFKDGDESNLEDEGNDTEEVVEECIESNDKLYESEESDINPPDETNSDQNDMEKQDITDTNKDAVINNSLPSPKPIVKSSNIDQIAKKGDSAIENVEPEDPLSNSKTTQDENSHVVNLDDDDPLGNLKATDSKESHVVDIDEDDVDDAESVKDDSEEITIDESANEVEEVTTGAESAEVQSSSSKDDKKDSSNNEEDEVFEDPLMANAVVDLTEENDEPNPSSSNAEDDDDIVVLLEKTDSAKKKKQFQPIPIYVKVNSTQKEKIITDSVDLMCLIQCSICKKSRREIRGHVRTTHKMEFEKYKQTHGETMHFSRLTYHRCKMCKKLIVYEFWNFRNHLRRSHNMDTVRYSLKYLEQKKKPKPAEKPAAANHIISPSSFSNCVSEMCKFQCKICMQSFSFLPEHVKNHHNFGFPQYKANFGNELQLTTVMYHKCNICQKVLRFDRPTLQKHLAATHKAKLGAYMKHYLSKKPAEDNSQQETVERDPLDTSTPPPLANAGAKPVKNLGKFKVSSSLTITKVRTNDNDITAASSSSTGVGRGGIPVFPGRGRGRGRGHPSNIVNEPKIFTDNPDDMCLTMCRLCGAELKPKSLSNHLINQHQSSLVRYKHEFGKEIVFTKLRYHKCKICGKILKFESKQMCYHLTSVHSVSFTSYKEEHLNLGPGAIRRRSRGGASLNNMNRMALNVNMPTMPAMPRLQRMPSLSLRGQRPNPFSARALWPGMAGVLQAAAAANAVRAANATVYSNNVSHVLPDLYTPPHELGMDMDLSDDSPAHQNNSYHLGYNNGAYDDSGNDADEGIDPLQCLSVSIDQNGTGTESIEDENNHAPIHEQEENNQQEQDTATTDVKDNKNFNLSISSNLAAASSSQPGVDDDNYEAEAAGQPDEDSILPDLDGVDITENPIKIEPSVVPDS